MTSPPVAKARSGFAELPRLLAAGAVAGRAANSGAPSGGLSGPPWPDDFIGFRPTSNCICMHLLEVTLHRRPVADRELSHQVVGGTLVWAEGLPGWLPYAEARLLAAWQALCHPSLLQEVTGSAGTPAWCKTTVTYA
jgi:hypothetical protein